MLINQDEASEFLNSLKDEKLKNLLLLAKTQVFLMEHDPRGSFDMLFFFKVLADYLPRINPQPPLAEDNDTVFG